MRRLSILQFYPFYVRHKHCAIHMKYYLVAFATLFAMFWDEVVITLITMVLGKQVNKLFMVGWMICSGILTSVLVSYHVPMEYRVLTIILITFAVVFSLQGYLASDSSKDDNHEKTVA